MEASFDYVVVGGGTAGSIVAARLAEDRDVSVALLEAGPSDEGDERILEIGNWWRLAGSELDHRFSIEPQERGNTRLEHSRLRVLGGCSSHNQAIAFPAPTSDLERWEALGAAGWGPDACRPYFERVLGRVHVEAVRPDNACAAAFVEAAQQAGFPLLSFADRNPREGVGWLRLNVRGRLRQSSSVAYLHPVARLASNLRVLTETTALRVLVDEGSQGSRAVGVETTHGSLGARREVIVSCGALDSPKLLLLSGIGPAQDLRLLGIRVAVPLLGVGRHLIDHPEGTVIWEASRPVPTGFVQDWETALFARTDPVTSEPDLMIHFGTMPASADFAPPGAPTAEEAFWMTPNVTRPRSEGSLRLRSADPADAPLIDPRYYTDPEGHDERVMLAGMKLARRLAEQTALRAWVKVELVPGPDVRDDGALSEHARLSGGTVHHPAGTCRLGGPNDPLAVVDPELRVRGVAGLRVADASVFPAMIGVNICLTCMMVGERCADLVRATARA